MSSDPERKDMALGEASSSFSAIIAEEVAARPSSERPWCVERDEAPDRIWIRVFRKGHVLPDQGWKLHISATASSAREVLRRSLGILLASDVAFKVAEEDALETLNSGDAGLTQVGKFITVYTPNDEVAVRIAVALDAATRGMRGPAVPFETPVAQGSLVYYRYGSFIERLSQDASGAMVPVISGPNGELVPDHPSHPPDWVPDPFVSAGLSATSSSRLIGGRYALTSTLHRAATGGVYLALDLRGLGQVVLKRARRDTRVGPDGRDSRDYLRHEASVLARLQPYGRFPKPLDLVEHEGDLYLAMEHIEGVRLGDYLDAYIRSGRIPAGETVVAWGRSLASALASIHEEGYAYRDLNPANVLIGKGQRLCVIDLGNACAFGEDIAGVGVGTRGFCSRQQVDGGPPHVADDVYGLGALLFYLATGADPADAPDPFRLTSRPMRLLNPALSPELEDVIVRCLAERPQDRPQRMAEVDALLAQVAGRASRPAPPLGEEAIEESEELFRRRCHERARRLGDTLCAIAAPRQRTSAPDARVTPRDITGGTAGLVLALADLVDSFGDPQHRRVLEAAAGSLQRGSLEGSSLPGLYVGSSGVGAALLRAGQIIQDGDLIRTAAQLGDRVATMPHGGPDLYNGTAGRVRFHLLLFDETGDERHLRAALAGGERLLQTAERDGESARWTSGEEAMAGYAHGAAGIADVLLDLFEVSGEERFVETVVAAARWLQSLRTGALDDDVGFTWRETEGGPRSAPTWCRGAAGIGRFYLHAAELGVVEGARDVALGAARTVARAGRGLDPSQCHGLAGNVEFLLDAARPPGDEVFRAEAMSLGRVLDSWALEMDGLLVFPSDTPDEPTPDYMTGWSGVAVCLLRLADPESRAYQLSRKGFRSMKSPTVEAS